MALIKSAASITPVYEAPGAVIDQAVAGAEYWREDEPTTALQPAQSTMPSLTPIANLAAQGFEGLELDWTSYTNISLKPDGTFQDADGNSYGRDFTCYLRGSKSRWVYRGNPVTDNKRDVLFSYDKIASQNGILVADKLKEWAAQGKTVEEKLYLEALVEMVAPGEAHDGDYCILSVSPTSRGRFSGCAAKAAALGGGDPGNVVTRVSVGPKVMKVANPFFPWNFDIAKTQ